MDRAQRHSAMVDFMQYSKRETVVLEEDHIKVEKERDQFKNELEALRKDAERYRWLRDECHLFEHYRKATGHVAKFDDEIDAAKSKEPTP
ncbi:hypothetical protein ACUTAH_02950 [Metapseudomonas furukawaii]|uniref:hypothetical protein n=1 Tax=Metapseudomonas furukawaii TaxID=1149133 RepID=UPI0040461A86